MEVNRKDLAMFLADMSMLCERIRDGQKTDPRLGTYYLATVLGLADHWELEADVQEIISAEPDAAQAQLFEFHRRFNGISKH